MENRNPASDVKEEDLTPVDNEKKVMPSDEGSSLPAESLRIPHLLAMVDLYKPSGILRDTKLQQTAESIDVVESAAPIDRLDENLSVDKDIPMSMASTSNQGERNYDPMTYNTSISGVEAFLSERDKWVKTGAIPKRFGHMWPINKKTEFSRSTTDRDKIQSKAEEMRRNRNKRAAEEKFEKLPESTERYYNPAQQSCKYSRDQGYSRSRDHRELKDDDSEFVLVEKAKKLLLPSDLTDAENAAMSVKSYLLPDAMPIIDRSVDDPQKIDLPGSSNKDDSDVGLLGKAGIYAQSAVLPVEEDALPKMNRWIDDPRNFDLSESLYDDDPEMIWLDDERDGFVFPEHLPKVDRSIDHPQNFNLYDSFDDEKDTKIPRLIDTMQTEGVLLTSEKDVPIPEALRQLDRRVRDQQSLDPEVEYSHAVENVLCPIGTTDSVVSVSSIQLENVVSTDELPDESLKK